MRKSAVGRTRKGSGEQAVRASFWFAFCSIVQKGIQFITTPLFTRFLTTEQYGQFSLYQSWLSLISIFATLNLFGGVFNNGMTRYDKDRDRYTSAMQGLTIVTVAIVFGIYIVAAEKWEDLIGLPRIAILIMFAEILFVPALNFWSARQRYEFRYRALVAVTICMALLNPVLSFVTIQLTSERGLARIFGAAVVNISVGCFFFILNFLRGRKLYVKEYWNFALKFNIPLIPHYLSQMALSQADRIMIGNMYGKSSVAIYSLAYSIGLVMNIVTNSVNASFSPWAYQKLSTNQYARIGKVANLILLIIACITMVPILTAPEIVTVMGPSEYAEAKWIIPPVAVAGYFILLYTLFVTIEFYFEENKFVMAASTIAAISNIVLNYVFMKLFGYMAAGYTTLVCYMILSVAHYLFMRRVLKNHNVHGSVYNLKLILFITAVLGLSAALCMALFRLPILRYTLLITGMIIMFWKRDVIYSLVGKLCSGKKVH